MISARPGACPVFGANNFSIIPSTKAPGPSIRTRSADSRRTCAVSGESAAARVSQRISRASRDAVALPKLPSDVASHRQAAQRDRSNDFERIEQSGQVVGQPFHRDGSCGHVAGSEPAQIRGDHATCIRQGVDLPRPHRVIQWKTMHQQQRLAAASFQHVQFHISHPYANHHPSP
jgi:hypothetical protein